MIERSCVRCYIYTTWTVNSWHVVSFASMSIRFIRLTCKKILHMTLLCLDRMYAKCRRVTALWGQYIITECFDYFCNSRGDIFKWISRNALAYISINFPKILNESVVTTPKFEWTKDKTILIVICFLEELSHL